MNPWALIIIGIFLTTIGGIIVCLIDAKSMDDARRGANPTDKRNR